MNKAKPHYRIQRMSPPRPAHVPEDWPSHRPSTLLPNGVEQVYEHFPIRKINECLYCKYCYTKHSEWWLMAIDDYGRSDVVLCGKCEYTSVMGFMGD